MSEKEIKRLEVMRQLEDRRMKQGQAAEELGVSVRQVKRLVKKYREEGAEGLVSKRRGQPSNNRLAEETRGKALDLLKEKYQGFGPTPAHEKLTEVEGLTLSDERLRQLMIEEGLMEREAGCSSGSASDERATGVLRRVGTSGWLTG